MILHLPAGDQCPQAGLPLNCGFLRQKKIIIILLRQLTSFFIFRIVRLLLHVVPLAEVVKLVDTLASGASGGNPVEVQVLSSAPFL